MVHVNELFGVLIQLPLRARMVTSSIQRCPSGRVECGLAKRLAWPVYLVLKNIRARRKLAMKGDS